VTLKENQFLTHKEQHFQVLLLVSLASPIMLLEYSTLITPGVRKQNKIASLGWNFCLSWGKNILKQRLPKVKSC